MSPEKPKMYHYLDTDDRKDNKFIIQVATKFCKRKGATNLATRDIQVPSKLYCLNILKKIYVRGFFIISRTVPVPIFTPQLNYLCAIRTKGTDIKTYKEVI